MKRIILISILTILGIGFLTQILFSYNFESRTYFWRITESGFIIFLGLSLLAIYYMVHVFSQGKLLGAFMMLIPVFMVSTCTVMSSGLYPQYYDYIVYKSENTPSKLIIQYYETGITGNPKKRLILTKDEDKAIRAYIELDKHLIPDSLSFDSRDWERLVPLKLIIEGEVYTVDKINNPDRIKDNTDNTSFDAN